MLDEITRMTYEGAPDPVATVYKIVGHWDDDLTSLFVEGAHAIVYHPYNEHPNMFVLTDKEEAFRHFNPLTDTELWECTTTKIKIAPTHVLLLSDIRYAFGTFWDRVGRGESLEDHWGWELMPVWESTAVVDDLTMVRRIA